MARLEESFLAPALKNIRQHIPLLVDTLKIADKGKIDKWCSVIDGKLLPRFMPDFPLMVAICGGGSSGKSTLFNYLARAKISPVGGKAGINRRVLVSANNAHDIQSGFFSMLFNYLGYMPEPLNDIEALTVPGDPLYLLSKAIPKSLVLMDTPDFDTGAKGVYTNRTVSRKAIEASDILIYIFTNSNYNNRDNTDFIAEMLTGIGVRKCFLVYRVYPSFKDSEVFEHAMTVARNIYGDNADQYLLGIYRADEDNQVAAGLNTMDVRPLKKDAPLLSDALEKIDIRTLRLELHSAILKDVLKVSQKISIQAKISLNELGLYLDALRTVQSRCIQRSLQHFPMDQVFRRFARIWLKTDPPHIKAMRKTGSFLALPVKVITRTIKWAGRTISQEKTVKKREDFSDHLKTDLLEAANAMHDEALKKTVSVMAPAGDPVVQKMKNTVTMITTVRKQGSNQKPMVEQVKEKEAFVFHVLAHPSIEKEQLQLRDKNWKAILQSILSEKEVIVSLSREIETELKTLAENFRCRMGLLAKINQTFSAFLNVLPATVAVTYILSTGDPVGAAGIKVKLTGLFGLHDLYALVAIPATTGLNKADRLQLEAMLEPVAKTWFESKMETVQEIFEKKITGEIFEKGKETLKTSEKRIKIIEKNIKTLKKGLIQDER